MERKILDVLKSKRIVTLVITLAVALLVSFFPQFADSEAQIIDNASYLAALAIVGFSATDIFFAWLSRAGSVNLLVSGAQLAVDKFEDQFNIDIPDALEAPALNELRELLQRTADDYAEQHAKG